MLFLLNLKKKTSFSISERDVCLHFAFEEYNREKEMNYVIRNAC